MKKICLLLTAMMLSVIIPIRAVAANPQLTVKNDNGEVKVDITSSMRSKPINELLPNLVDCKDEAEAKINLKAEATVNITLRLVFDSLSLGVNPLNNYELTVADSENAIIYDSNTVEPLEVGEKYKDIDLGQLTAGNEKTFTVTYKLIDESIDVSKVTAEIVAQSDVAETPVATVKPVSTPAPKFDFDSIEEVVIGVENDLKNETTKKETKKVCGVDIPEGRFSVTGNGVLSITTEAGRLKGTAVISEDPKVAMSVETVIANLTKGDVITITPLDGYEKASIKFSKVATEPGDTSITPVDSNGDKTNPKTGDGSTAMLITVSVLAVLAFAALEVLKRRGNSNN